MLTYVLKLHYVQLIDDFFPYVIVLLITNYCQHFVCGNPDCYCSYLDVSLTLFPISRTTDKRSQRKCIKVTATIKINMSFNGTVNCYYTASSIDESQSLEHW